MKKINFITTLSPQKQYEIARWFLFSVAVVVVTFLIGSYFIVPELLTCFSLKKEISALRADTKDYGQLIKSRDALKKESDVMHARKSTLDRYNKNSKNPFHYVAALKDACGDGGIVELIRFIKKDCELTVLCPTPEHVTVIIKRLSASDKFGGIKLVSLQNDAQAKKMRAVIKAGIVNDRLMNDN